MTAPAPTHHLLADDLGGQPLKRDPLDFFAPIATTIRHVYPSPCSGAGWVDLIDRASGAMRRTWLGCAAPATCSRPECAEHAARRRARKLLGRLDDVAVLASGRHDARAQNLISLTLTVPRGRDSDAADALADIDAARAALSLAPKVVLEALLAAGLAEPGDLLAGYVALHPAGDERGVTRWGPHLHVALAPVLARRDGDARIFVELDADKLVDPRPGFTGRLARAWTSALAAMLDVERPRQAWRVAVRLHTRRIAVDRCVRADVCRAWAGWRDLPRVRGFGALGSRLVGSLSRKAEALRVAARPPVTAGYTARPTWRPIVLDPREEVARLRALRRDRPDLARDRFGRLAPTTQTYIRHYAQGCAVDDVCACDTCAAVLATANRWQNRRGHRSPTKGLRLAVQGWRVYLYTVIGVFGRDAVVAALIDAPVADVTAATTWLWTPPPDRSRVTPPRAREVYDTVRRLRALADAGIVDASDTPYRPSGGPPEHEPDDELPDELPANVPATVAAQIMESRRDRRAAADLADDIATICQAAGNGFDCSRIESLRELLVSLHALGATLDRAGVRLGDRRSQGPIARLRAWARAARITGNAEWARAVGVVRGTDVRFDLAAHPSLLPLPTRRATERQICDRESLPFQP